MVKALVRVHIEEVIENPHLDSLIKTILLDENLGSELDYSITKDRAVLHDLFMLTTFPFSRCIWIGMIIVNMFISFE